MEWNGVERGRIWKYRFTSVRLLTVWGLSRRRPHMHIRFDADVNRSPLLVIHITIAWGRWESLRSREPMCVCVSHCCACVFNWMRARQQQQRQTARTVRLDSYSSPLFSSYLVSSRFLSSTCLIGLIEDPLPHSSSALASVVVLIYRRRGQRHQECQVISIGTSSESSCPCLLAHNRPCQLIRLIIRQATDITGAASLWLSRTAHTERLFSTWLDDGILLTSYMKWYACWMSLTPSPIPSFSQASRLDSLHVVSEWHGTQRGRRLLMSSSSSAEQFRSSVRIFNSKLVHVLAACIDRFDMWVKSH